jgi:predicted phosphodiesterase
LKTLVLSDIHGNEAALQAVLAEPHDAVLCLGDLVGYGPEPAACIRLLRAEDALGVAGNHDRALSERIPSRCSARFQWLAEATERIAAAEVSPDDLAWLGALPPRRSVRLDDVPFTLLHATPSDPLYRYRGPDPQLWRADTEATAAGTLLVGHTHLQFRLAVDGAEVVNPGSVGQPKDADPRAAYAVVEGGKVTLKRAAYDVEQTIRALEAKCALRPAAEALAALLRTGRVPEMRQERPPG